MSRLSFRTHCWSVVFFLGFGMPAGGLAAEDLGPALDAYSSVYQGAYAATNEASKGPEPAGEILQGIGNQFIEAGKRLDQTFREMEQRIASQQQSSTDSGAKPGTERRRSTEAGLPSAPAATLEPVVIDGSQFPKELEFTAKNKAPETAGSEASP